jgi:hypothetical protein
MTAARSLDSILSTRARRLATAAPFALVSLAACAVSPGGTESSQEATTQTHEAIVGGSLVASDTLGSVEVLQCLVPTSSCTYTYGVAGWGCSGTMVADGWLLTAHHCVSVGGQALTGGTAVAANTIRVQNQNNTSWATGVAIYRHPTLDVALVQLDGSVYGPGGQPVTTPIYTGAGTSLQGTNIYCQGYGLSQEEPTQVGFGTLRSMSFNVQWAGTGWIDYLPPSGAPYLAPGDSGSGCFRYPPGTANNAVVATDSFEDVAFPGAPPSEEGLVGADGFESWASTTIGNVRCTDSDYSCGTVSDGMGGTVSCGTCGTGDICQSGHYCVCAPQKCKVGKWSYVNCDCEVPCHTPAQCCAQAGGYWDGKYCE